MRRSIVPLLVLVSVLGLGACSQVEDAAQQVVDKVACKVLASASGKLPSGTDLDGTRITQAASAAKKVQSALSNIPGDKVPASITDRVQTAAADLQQASDTYASDPAAAQAKAQDALDQVQSAITDASGRLKCGS